MHEKIKNEVMRYLTIVANENLQICVSNTKYFETMFDVSFIIDKNEENTTQATFSLTSGFMWLKSGYMDFKLLRIINNIDTLIRELNYNEFEERFNERK